MKPNKFAKSIYTATIIITSIMLLSGCNREDNTPNNPITKKETLKIGAVLPLSGWAAYYGVPFKDGMEVAVEKINSQDKIFEMFVEDTKSDTKESVNAYNYLEQVKNSDTYFTVFSNTTDALIPLIKENNELLFTDAAAKSLVEKYIYTFDLFYDPGEKCKLLAQRAIDDGAQQLILPVLNIEWGLNCRAGIISVAKPKDIPVVSYEYNMSDTDFSTLVLKIKNETLDKQPYVLMATYESFYLEILSEFKKQNLKARFYGMDKADFLSDKVIERVGTDFLRGSVYLTSKKKNQSDNPFAEGYEGVMLLYYAYKDCDCQKNVDCLSDKLKNSSYSGKYLYIDGGFRQDRWLNAEVEIGIFEE